MWIGNVWCVLYAMVWVLCGLSYARSSAVDLCEALIIQFFHILDMSANQQPVQSHAYPELTAQTPLRPPQPSGQPTATIIIHILICCLTRGTGVRVSCAIDLCCGYVCLAIRCWGHALYQISVNYSAVLQNPMVPLLMTTIWRWRTLRTKRMSSPTPSRKFTRASTE